MHHKKRSYRIGTQLTIMKAESKRVNEKYIPVPDYILSEWKKHLSIGDKKRIALTQNLAQSELTSAFRGHATPETINKVNRYFEISRKDFKIKAA